MTRTLLTAVLVLVAAACGSDQDPTLSGPVPSSGQPTSTSAEERPDGTVPPTVPAPEETACTGVEPTTGDDLSLGVTHGELRSGAPVTWTLTLTNGGDSDVELVFGTGQDGDVALSDGETEVYRWSDEMAFTQAVRCQVIPAGATATYELRQPVLDVEPGQYQLRASLAATPKPPDVATQVTVG